MKSLLIIQLLVIHIESAAFSDNGWTGILSVSYLEKIA